MKFWKICICSFALVLLVFYSDLPLAAQEDSGSVSQPLIGAANDADTPLANSTVRLSGPCTGTLIAPQVVISAGHCGFYDGRLGWEPDQWFNVAAAGINIVAEFGPDSSSFRDRIPVTHVNISGNRDLILLALERAPSPSVAVPRSPLLYLPAAARRNPERFWRNQTFTAAGWGGQDPATHSGNLATTRQTALATDPDLDCDVGWEGAICVRSGLSGQSQTRGGDSGGPLYWTNPADGQSYLVGVLQGYGPEGDRYHYLWSDFQLGWPGNQGTPPGQRIDLAQRDWIRYATDRSFCGVLRRSTSESARAPMLYLWWNPTRGDNFSTTQPVWAGCEGDQLQGYHFAGVLGLVFSAEQPQPTGTIPLYHWWSQSRGDNFLTSDPRWAGRPGDQKSPDYRFVRVEGYVYPPEFGNRDGVEPLWSWWSGEREDNFATTDARWAPESAGGHAPDYQYYRLEGYTLSP